MDKDNFSKGVHAYLRLIHLYLNNKEDPEYEVNDKRLAFFTRLSKANSLSALLYLTLKNTKVKIDKDKLNSLEASYAANIKKGIGFDKERKELYQYLTDNKINYLPLKGIILNNYYPDAYAREYADNDIMFDDDKTDIVKQFFVDRDYQVDLFKTYNHDTYTKKPFYNFEMHRALFYESKENEKFIPYFANILNRSPIKEGYEHYLTNEDFYIYFTAHSYKHYRASGCGLRTLIDYYVFLKNNKIDFDYINQELVKIDLLEFSNNISSLSLKVFDNEPLNQDEEEMLLFIASSGTYGTIEHRVERGIKEKGKFKYLWSRVFPPLSFYKMFYPRAYKSKVLIPFAWFYRLIKSPKKASKELKIISKQKKVKNKQ